MVVYPSWLYIESADPEPALASFLPNHSCLRGGGKSRLILLDCCLQALSPDLVVTCAAPVTIGPETRARDMN